MSEPRVLCFTPTFNRWTMAQACIRGMLAQTHPAVTHAVLFLDTAPELVQRTRMEFLDEIGAGRLVIGEGGNAHQYDNALTAIELGLTVCPAPDLFLKIDDDDWYSKYYVASVVRACAGRDFDLSGQSDYDVVSLAKDGRSSFLPARAGVSGPTMAFPPPFLELIRANVHHPDKTAHYEDWFWVNVLASRLLIRPNHGLMTYFRHSANTSH